MRWHNDEDVAAWLAAVAAMTCEKHEPSPAEIESMATSINTAWSNAERSKRCLWAHQADVVTSGPVDLARLHRTTTTR